MGINSYIFNLLHSLAWRDPLFDFIVIFCAQYLQYVVIIFAIFLILSRVNKDYPGFRIFYQIKKVIRELIRIFIIVIIAWGVTDILKNAIAFPRPFLVYENLQPLFIHGGMDSMPSGHATMFSAFSYLMYRMRGRIAMPIIYASICIMLARIIAGVHFPVDILAGILVGITVSSLLLKLEDRFLKNNIKKQGD